MPVVACLHKHYRTSQEDNIVRKEGLKSLNSDLEPARSTTDSCRTPLKHVRLLSDKCTPQDLTVIIN